MTNNNDKTTSILLQLSVLSQYFIPLGNIIFPVLIWSLKRKESGFVDENGKQVINFQLSLLLYCLVIILIAIPIILYSAFHNNTFIMENCEWILNEFNRGRITGIIATVIVSAILFSVLKVLEFCLVLYAAVKNSNGESYKYPITINFIK